MSKKRADHEAGFVLHTYAYKETSLIVEAFTRRFGRVSLLARGARRPRSAMRGVLLSFQALSLSWSASTELGNLIGAEWSAALRPLRGRGLMCGFYLNELLLRLLAREDPHEALFDYYDAPRRGDRPPFCPAQFRKAHARGARVCSRARARRRQPADRSGGALRV
jgi:DNA repair protein RecO (recombination protein O)